jgi:hypothetical protein
VPGAFGVSGDLTVDTSTLKVNTTSNRVGIGEVSPQSILHVTSTSPRITMTDTDTGADHRINADSGAGNLAFDVDYNSETSAPSVVFNLKGSEKIRILNSGGITFNGDTAAANALDDYEEGTFTPTLYHSSTNDSTFSSANGEYTKIGNTVTCQLRIDGGTSGTAGSFLVIGGLPFAVSQAQGNMGIGIWGSNPSNQVGNIHGYNPPRLFKGGTDVSTQMSFFTAMLVYKTS